MSAFQSNAFQNNAFQVTAGDAVCTPAFQLGSFQSNAFQVCEPATSGGWLPWLERPKAKKAREDNEKANRRKWREIERIVEEAYLEATGQPKAEVKKQVKEALRDQSPQTVESIAARLRSSENAQAIALSQQIESQIADLKNLSIIYERMVDQAKIEFMQQDEDALVMLLLS